MSINKKTRNPGYKAGDNWLICDVCGCAIYASEALQRWDGMVTCKKDWEPRHEQDFVRARKDKIAAELVRPEGEDDYSTIPGISGPDPIPPGPTDFFHDFSKDQLGDFTCERPSHTTTFDHQGTDIRVGVNVPPLAGYAWDGVGKYTDVGVGQGVHIASPVPEGEAPTDIQAWLGNLRPLPDSLANNYSGQFTFTITVDWVDLPVKNAPNWTPQYFFEMVNKSGNVQNLQVYARPPAGAPTLFLRLRINGDDTATSWTINDSAILEAVTGTRFDIRFRKSNTSINGDNGFKFWLYIDGVLHNTYSPATAYVMDHEQPMNHIDIGSEAYTPIRATHVAPAIYQYVRLHPRAETDEVIESWPTWTPPT